MRILLDTHAFLWAIADDPRLGPISRELIDSRAEAVLLSLVSLWEIAIKHSLGRGDMPITAVQALAWTEESGFDWLPLAPGHILCLEDLPPHHRDPFDRLLIAQAISEDLTLLSADAVFSSYGAPLQAAGC
ncbi:MULTISPECIES: type II toxin-antitoxin system VapC family toxin [unclassified Synechococcus]|uniref:type II toxin-antitoxin system VapC family toxin n=1 Tax=unclassified Synechococcus TaxID=2626047 RepID=UPI00006996EE|nr:MULTISPECIES: type II toxin-antitoxin system VapC family toxin [unclassified Synechococcus]EAQ75246.1 PilT protein, N-terminal [Synechococcus sp. WH 5701]WFN57840.1 type II toxin-antitoxin system VapC family toxin [Synechococcus sp. CCFWC 502]